MDDPPITAAPPPAPVPVAAGNRRTWERAAMLSLVAPFAEMGISSALSSDIMRPGDLLAARILGWICIFLIPAGLVLGIAALFKTRRYGRTGIFGPALGGTILNGGFVLMMLLAPPQVLNNMERPNKFHRPQQIQRP
jgi:hypothetical protein